MYSRILAFALLFTVLLGTSVLPATAKTRQDAALRTLDNAAFSLSEIKGKPAIVAIGATWLPLSSDQAKIINELSKTYGGQDVAILWVSVDSDTPKSKNYASNDQIKSFAERNKLTARVLRDPGSTIVKQFEVDELPSFVVLDERGEIVGQPIGGIDTKNNSTLSRITGRVDGLL